MWFRFLLAGKKEIKANIKKVERMLGPDIKFKYGTAGIRDKGEKLNSAAFGVGIFVAKRSLLEGKAYGIVITASHNPACDNGLKIINHNGKMIDEESEREVEKLANLSEDQIKEIINEEIINEEIINEIEKSQEKKGIVFLGYDTRTTSPELANQIKKASNLIGIELINYRLQSTPIMHYIVGKYNDEKNEIKLRNNLTYNYAELVEDYYNNLILGTEEIIKGIYNNKIEVKEKIKEIISNLVIDTANGVGYYVIKKLEKLLDLENKIYCVNGLNGELNYKCGEDYVYNNKIAPLGIKKISPKIQYVSIDGDADRAIFFISENIEKNQKEETDIDIIDLKNEIIIEPWDSDYTKNKLEVSLICGDYIGLLFAEFIKKILEKYQLNGSISIIETSTSNEAKNNYMKSRGFLVKKSSVGVKNLQKEAQNCEIGVYFEQNGHGSIHFSDQFKEYINRESTCNNAKLIFNGLMRLASEYTGDAIANVLISLLALDYLNLTLKKVKNFFKPNNNVLMACNFNRDNLMIIETKNYESEIVNPKCLLNLVEKLKEEFKVKIIIRTSGTEPLVRVYIEALESDSNLEFAALKIKDYMIKNGCHLITETL